MGCPDLAYQIMLVKFIQREHHFDKKEVRDTKYSDEVLYDKPIEELEKMVMSSYPDDPIERAFYGGLACASFFNEWHDSCDMVNASGGAIIRLLDLLRFDT